MQDSLLEAAMICLAAPLVNWGLRQVSVSELFNTFSGAEGFSRFQHGIRTSRSLLHKRGIIEYSTSQGLADRTYLRLTHAACKSLFTELEVSLEEEIPITLKELLTHQDIRPKALFYNAAESQQKIRLFPDPDIDNWIEAEIACEQDGELISRLFDASAQESLGMEVYPDAVVLTPAEQAFCCLYAVIKHEEAVWYLDYLHRTHIG